MEADILKSHDQTNTTQTVITDVHLVIGHRRLWNKLIMAD